MPETETPNVPTGSDIDRVLDLAIELGELARRVRREWEAGGEKGIPSRPKPKVWTS